MLIYFHLVGQNQLDLNPKKQIKSLHWLTGTWIKNPQNEKVTYETWTKTSSEEMQGKGITMKGKDTVFVEKLSILIKDNKLYYVADVAHNPNPVYFEMKEVSKNGFVCENPTHDFPKKIAYQKEGNSLKATISGDGKSIDFLFVREE